MAARSNSVATAKDVAEKWGDRVADRGFAQLPNYLLYLNQFLDAEHKLSAIELLVLVQIVATWWRKDELPFPSMATLANRCGVSERQVQRAVAQLEKGHFLKRVKRRNSGIVASNAYDLSPLAVILDTVAKAFPNAYPRNAGQGGGIVMVPEGQRLAAQQVKHSLANASAGEWDEVLRRLAAENAPPEQAPPEIRDRPAPLTRRLIVRQRPKISGPKD